MAATVARQEHDAIVADATEQELVRRRTER